MTLTKNPRLIAAISGHFIIDLYTPVLPIVLPFLMETMGLSYFLAGLIVTVFNVVSSIAQPFVGLWGDKTGKHADVAFCVLLGSLGISLSVLTSNYLILLFLVIGAGIGHALFHPAGMNLIYKLSPPGKLGLYNSIFTTAGSISYALGPLVAGILISLFGLPSVVWMVLPGIIGAFWIFRLTRKKTPAYRNAEVDSVKKEEVIEGNRVAAGLVVIVCALRAIGYMGIITYLPTLLIQGEWSMSASLASLVVTFMLLAGIVGQLAGGWLSDRFGCKLMLVIGLIAAIPSFCLIFVSGWVMFLGIMLYAFFASFCYVTSVTMTQELLPGKTGLASGLTLGFTLGLGGLSASLVGIIADYSGNLSDSLFLLIIPIVIAPIVALFVKYRKKREYNA
ncbi:MAG TPA: MFS transporter [Methanocorpusculum sp.]|nr:MFS transporter [Methanocorpusculum sp.]HJJ40412.1 MFS transporter [Methanocorpusculum sp.]HJJ49707.1 MFS transporter [Methanocorpusculum sp.]HJJ57645.1 MFS transporter [Methanocorpusculum sp.]